jgi:hypothetical protein
LPRCRSRWPFWRRRMVLCSACELGGAAWVERSAVALNLCHFFFRIPTADFVWSSGLGR